MSSPALHIPSVATMARSGDVDFLNIGTVFAAHLPMGAIRSSGKAILGAYTIMQPGTPCETCGKRNAARKASTPASVGIITSLAELPRETILDEAALAKAFGVVSRTVKRMVARHELPPPIFLASKRCWKVGAVLDWLDASIERTEKDAKRQIQRLRSY